MNSFIVYVQVRGVRTFCARHFKQPWAFHWRNKGLKVMGPTYEEFWEWPEKGRGFSELSPKFKNNNLEALQDYQGEQRAGFKDSTTNKWVHVEEMEPELVVPDLTNCHLKPYVSFRVPDSIIKAEYAKREITAEVLFEKCYSDNVKTAYQQGKYKDVDSVLENNRKEILKSYRIPVSGGTVE